MKLIKIIVLGSILFSLNTYSSDSLFKKFYVNGMSVTEEESKDSLDSVNEYLANNEVEKYKLFYNPTGNKKQSEKIEVRKPFEDLDEVFYQKHREYLKEKQWKEKIVRDYITKESLQRIKYYCGDKSHLECISYYKSRSIASEGN